MNITTRKGTDYPEGRRINYLELVITGDKHTFSIRQYPANTTLQMYKNSDKRGTKISYKYPNNKFDTIVHSQLLMDEFGVKLDWDTFAVEERWNNLVSQNNF